MRWVNPGLIPERAETVTSVTCGKSRTFNTPAGRFTYWSVPVAAYHPGIDLVDAGGRRSFLIASREKALADFVCHDRGSGLRRVAEFESYLLDNLRADPGILAQLDPDRLAAIGASYGSNKVGLLARFVCGIRTLTIENSDKKQENETTDGPSAAESQPKRRLNNG